ncbi:Formation of crista junctions protein 1 [Entophlyctis luteolus]|nr:Formation of crista junctions protein 1 [Entophlyctis luteolus]
MSTTMLRLRGLGAPLPAASRAFSASAAPKKSTRIVLPLVATASVMAAGFGGAALYANSDPAAKQVWIDNANITGGQRSIDTVLAAVDAVKAVRVEDVQRQISETQDNAVRVATETRTKIEAGISDAHAVWEKTSKSLTDTYESTAATIASAQKAVTDATNSAFEAIESVKTSILGPSNGVPGPKSSTSEKPKIVSASTSSAKASSNYQAAEQIVSQTPKPDAELEDVPIDFTPLDGSTPHTVVTDAEVAGNIAPSTSKSPEGSAKKKKAKKETAAPETSQFLAAVAEKQIEAANRDINSATVFFPRIVALAKALDGIKSSSRNSDAIADAKDAVLALADEISQTTLGAGIGGGVSEAEVQAALVEQADAFIATISRQNQQALDALGEQERELAEFFEAALAEHKATLAKAQQESIAAEKAALALEFSRQLENAVQAREVGIEDEWKAKIKQLVDAERDGRLAKLDHLAMKMKFLEGIVINNGEYVEKMQAVQRIFAALQVVAAKVESGGSFKKELALLKKYGEEDVLVSSALEAVDDKVAATGIISLDELRHDFGSLSNKLRRIQLMPEQGGPIAYSVSYLLSFLIFPKHGFVAGSDTESVLARTNFYLSHGDLESAAREINQLPGWSKVLAHDWLKEARAHLEVKQALEIVETHVTLKHFGIV